MKKFGFLPNRKVSKKLQKSKFPEIEKCITQSPEKRFRPGGQYKRHCIRKLKSNITVKSNQEMSPPPFQTRESPDTYFENGADKTGTSGHRRMSYLEITRSILVAGVLILSGEWR